MERFHSTCSAKHDDSALESVSKALNQGLKVWMLTRQDLPELCWTSEQAGFFAKGAYHPNQILRFEK